MTLIIKTVSDSKQAQADLQALQKSVTNIEQQVSKTTSAFRSFAIAIGGVTGITLGLKAVMRLEDGFVNLQNRLKSVTDGAENVQIAFEGLNKIALKTRTTMDPLAKLYQRIAISNKESGINLRDTLKVTEAVAKTLKLSGASVDEARASLLQFGQGLGSGRLAGEELRSVLEGNIVLANTLAKAFNVPIGQLKVLGEAGKLRTGLILKGILAQADELDSKFQELGITFEDAFVNVGNGFRALYRSVTQYFFGSSNVIATWINNVGLGAAKIAESFSYYMYRAKASVFGLIFFSIDAFDQLKESAVRALSTIYKYLSDNIPNFSEAVSSIKAAFASIIGFVGVVIANVYDKIKGLFSKENFFTGVLDYIKSLAIAAKGLLSSMLLEIKIRIPKIKLEGIFDGLKPIYNFVKMWVSKVERAFFWLYDQVIGNSWIPDLVNGVSIWFRKLLSTPLGYLREFTTKSNGLFTKIAKGAAFAFALRTLINYRKQLLALIGLLTTAGAGFLFAVKSKRIEIEPGSTLEKIFKSLTKALDKVNAVYQKYLGPASPTARNFKQFFGMQDKTPGEIYGVPIDTNAKVGRGTQRSSESRFFLHDAINTISPQYQVAAVAGLTGIVTLAIVRSFEASFFRTALISAVTTVFGLAAVQGIQTATLKDSLYRFAFGIFDAVGKGVTFLLGGQNAIKDPLGLIALIAKTAILFEAGRAMLMAAGKYLVTAPTRAAVGVSDILERRALSRMANLENNRLQTQIASLRASAESSRIISERAINAVSSARDASGRLIGDKRASAAIRANDVAAFGPAASSLVAAAITAQNNARRLQGDLANTEAGKDPQSQRLAGVQKRLDTVSARLTEASENLKQGFKNISAGVGGVVGGVAGYQLGLEIARGLEDAPAWQRIAVTLATSVAGQGLGALLGLLTAKAFMFVTGLVTAGAMKLAGAVAGIIAVKIGALLTNALFGIILFAASFPIAFKVIIVGLIAAAVAGLAYFIINYGKKTVALMQEYLFEPFKQYVWAPFKEYVWEPIKKIAEGIYDYLVGGVNALKTKISDAFGNFTDWFFYRGKYAKDMAGPPAPGTKGYKNGGLVTGPGTGRSDSVSARLSNGEFVVNARSSEKYKKLLMAINGGSIPSFSPGGLIGIKEAAFLNKVLIQKTLKPKHYTDLESNSRGPVDPAASNIADPLIAFKSFELLKEVNHKDIWKIIQELDKRFKSSESFNLSSSVLRRANGGWIFGEGTEKSDSIPAMLSNGEYVINAKSAKRYRKLIEAINSGGVQGFATGGIAGTVSAGTAVVPVAIVKDESQVSFFQKFAKFFQNDKGEFTLKNLQELFTRAFSGRPSAVEGDGIDRSTLEYRLSTASLTNSLQAVQRALGNINFQVDVESLGKLSAESTERVALLLDDINKYQREIAKRPGTFVARKSEELSNEAQRELMKIFRANNLAFEPPSNFKDDVADEKELKLSDVFDIVSRAFPDLALKFDQFVKLPADLINDIFAQARAYESKKTDIDSTSIGTLRSSGGLPDLGRLYGDLDEMRQRSQEVLKQALTPYVDNFQLLESYFEKLGIALNKEVFDILSSEEIFEVKALSEAIRDLLGTANGPSGIVDESIRKAARESIQTAMERIETVTADAVSRTGSDYRVLTASLSKYGIEISNSLFNRLTNAERATISRVVARMNAQIPLTQSPDENVRATAQRIIDDMRDRLSAEIGAIQNPGQMKEAAKAFAGNSSRGFSESLKGFILGEDDDAGSAFKLLGDRLLDTFTENVVNTFVSGFSEFLTGEGSPINNLLTDLGAGIFGLGNKGAKTVSPKILEKGKDVITEGGSDNPLSKIFSESNLGSIWDKFKTSFEGIDFSSMFSGLLDAGKAIFNAVKGFMGFADGGYISGPGTGRSDSILARVSNGEYIVNAASTRQFLPLLNSINAGRLPRFASGGMVGEIQPISGGASSSQVINLTITGDISRQTRSEILGMLPQIAAGVNGHNRERNYRG